MVEQRESNGRPVWNILTKHGWALQDETLREVHELFEGGILTLSDTYFQAVIKRPPGPGKSHDATDFVHDAWEKDGYKGLYLMLSHAAIEERLGRLREDGRDKEWSHWRGHYDHCERRRFASAGYLSTGECTCQREERKVEGPTLASLDYILPGSPGETTPLVKTAEEFDFWVIDEMDFRRLLGYMRVSKGDVDTIAETHPDDEVRELCDLLSKLMGNLRSGERLNGERLYEAIDAALDEDGESLANLAAELWPQSCRAALGPACQMMRYP
jgi:hypothetical protein